MHEKQMSFQRKLTLGFSIISMIALGISAATSYFFTAHLVQDLTMNNLQDQIRGVESAIRVSTEENKERINHLMDEFGKKVDPNLDFHAANHRLVDEIGKDRG